MTIDRFGYMDPCLILDIFAIKVLCHTCLSMHGFLRMAWLANIGFPRLKNPPDLQKKTVQLVAKKKFIRS